MISCSPEPNQSFENRNSPHRTSVSSYRITSVSHDVSVQTHTVRGKDTQSVSLPLTRTHVHHDNRGHVMSRTHVALDWQGRWEGEVSRKFNLVTCRPAARAVHNTCLRGLCWFSRSVIRSRSCEVTVDRPRLLILNWLSFRRTVRMWLKVDQISRLQLHRVGPQLRRWQARWHRSAQEIHGRSWTQTQQLHLTWRTETQNHQLTCMTEAQVNGRVFVRVFTAGGAVGGSGLFIGMRPVRSDHRTASS